MQDNYSVYKHTTPTGKVYIGLTGQKNLNRRWDSGRGYIQNEHFFRAILKYGWDNIVHEVLASGLDKETACEMERALIASHHSTDPEYGYNIMPGGEHSLHSEQSREKIRRANLGRRHSAATIQKISENRKGKGYRTMSETTKQKLRENHGGGAEPKMVICISTGVVYGSINEAARDTGVDKAPISRCCRGVKHHNTAGGLRWAFYENKEET